MHNILLAGVGGQGTVLASKLIAKCAINRGENARTAETIGMAQRGGCVVSHVRIGEKIYSPLIPKGHADVIIGFEPAEAVRALPYLKSDGTVIVSSGAIIPVTDSLSTHTYDGTAMLKFLRNQKLHLIIVDAAMVLNKCGTMKALNIALLGAAAKANVLGASADELENVISTSLPQKFVEMNFRALKIGMECAK